MCAIDGAEPCEVWSETWQRARKPHACDECGRVIDRGERYNRVFWVYDGDPGGAVACQHCMRAGEWLELVCDGWLRNGLHEELLDHAGEYPGFWIRLVLSGVRNQWTTRDGRRWNLPGKPNPMKLGVPGLVAKEYSRVVHHWRDHWSLWGPEYRIPPPSGASF